MKKKRLFEEDMDKVLVGMNLKEANENKVKMDKPQQQIQKNELIFLKPKKTNEERKKELDEFGKMLEAGIKEYIESDRYKELLDNMANFHDYSVNNSIGIMIQKPDATLVAPYTKWQKLNRQVKKGEKGIVILCPIKYKKMTEETKLDAKGKPVLDKKGFEIKNKHIKIALRSKLDSCSIKARPCKLRVKKSLCWNL